MKRLKIIFAIFLLLLAIPSWRFMDIVAITSPFNWPLSVALVIWFALFVMIPFKFIFNRINTLILIVLIGTFGSLTWLTSPLSKMATTEPDFNHCGALTYTGVFYPIRGILSEAHHDDLDVRNQLCWIRKMISKVPKKFDSVEEVESYSLLIQKRLLKPEIKFRATLPLIAVLYFTVNTSSADTVGVKQIYDSLHFWIDHYTYEINSRDYSLWNWPHSDYIKFEYGLIEENWQKLIDNIVIEER